MLVIVNGAFRSGSTWLTHIVRSIVEHSDIPNEYCNNRAWKKGTSIHSKKLKFFLQQIDYKHKNYVSKNHLNKVWHRKTILSYKNVYILDIQRDIRDTLTSGYYYYRSKGEFSGNFEKFYWRRGRYLTDYIKRYHEIWRYSSPRIYISSYEMLKAEFNVEVRKIGRFLGIKLLDTDITEIRKGTDINKLRTTWREQGKSENERFFRKGIVGDWQNYFNAEMLRDLENIQRNGLKNIERFMLKLSSVSLQKIKRKILML